MCYSKLRVYATLEKANYTTENRNQFEFRLNTSVWSYVCQKLIMFTSGRILRPEVKMLSLAKNLNVITKKLSKNESDKMSSIADLRFFTYDFIPT